MTATRDGEQGCRAFFGGRANRNCRYIICKGGEKRKTKDDSGSSKI